MGAGSSNTRTGFSNLRHCTLWKADRSPACRAVLMTLDAMDLSITEVDVNMDLSEHKDSEITAMNPHQTLPVFKDREIILNDSHSICEYLASRYGGGSGPSVYPADPARRALINQLMFYNCGVLYPRYRAAADRILYDKCNFVLPQHVCNIENAYKDLEAMLQGRAWFGGDCPTLGDICIGATLSTMNILIPVDKKRYPHLSAWLRHLSDQLFYRTANNKGLIEFVQKIDCSGDREDEFKCPRCSDKRRCLASPSEA